MWRNIFNRLETIALRTYLISRTPELELYIYLYIHIHTHTHTHTHTHMVAVRFPMKL
jgi:hypothetical protein